MKYFAALLLAFSLVGSASAAPTGTPSLASIEKLLVVTDSARIMDEMFANMDRMMRNVVTQSMQQNSMSEEGRQIMENYMARMIRVMRDEIGWEKIKPIYVQVYSETFTQQEIDDMLVFYATPSGKSLIQKMPLVMERTTGLTQARLGPLMQRMQQELQQAIAEVKAKQAAATQDTPAAKPTSK